MPRINNATAMDAGLELWLIKTARKNFWRVASHYEIEDLIGDGYLVYAKCRRRYRTTITERRHFMALFQRAFLNHIIGLANKRTRELSCIVDGKKVNAVRVQESEILSFDNLIPPTLPEASLVTLLAEARFPIRPMIELFCTDKGRAVLEQLPQRAREPINAYLCRVMSLDPKQYNLPELFKSYLRGSGMFYMKERLDPLVIA